MCHSRYSVITIVLTRYHNTISVTNMLQQLNWESLCQRRAKMRLTMFYKSQHALVALPLPNVVQLPIRPRYKSIYWQPCRLDWHIHNTQYNTGIIKIYVYTYINKCELV